jgi:hypothetical protein
VCRPCISEKLGFPISIDSECVAPFRPRERLIMVLSNEGYIQARSNICCAELWRTLERGGGWRRFLVLLVCTEGADQRRKMRQKIATIGYAAAGLDASFRSKCCNEYAASPSLRSFTQTLGRKQPDARNCDAERVATPAQVTSRRDAVCSEGAGRCGARGVRNRPSTSWTRVEFCAKGRGIMLHANAVH